MAAGAGAGIGGSGGKGGNGNTGSIRAEDGNPGEDCGNINIGANITVKAYGGAGGSGGYSTTSAGTGGGGYPAAGIGGGGAGGGAGGEQAGGGGYSGGNQEPDGLSNKSIAYSPQVNGLTGFPHGTITLTRGVGGGYLDDITALSTFNSNNYYCAYGIIGGGAGLSGNSEACVSPGGNGGVAGQGGNVEVNGSASVYAYNGNKYTDETWTTNSDGTKTATYISGHENPSVNPSNQCQIYVQDGIYLKVAVPLFNWNDSKNDYYSNLLGKTINYSARNTPITNYNELTTFRDYNAKGTEFYIQGIGSGAGFLEISNGSYKIDGLEKMIKEE